MFWYILILHTRYGRTQAFFHRPDKAGLILPKGKPSGLRLLQALDYRAVRHLKQEGLYRPYAFYSVL